EFYTTRGYLRYELFSGTFVLSIPIVGWQDSTRWHVTDKRLGFGPFSTPQPATWLWRTVPPERDPLLWPKPESIDLAVVCCTYYPSSGTRSIAVVLWPIPPLLVACSALLLRSGILARRRSKAGCCTACGYDLTGLGAGAACPECGNAHPLRP
ncbi:MAG TPA: hypothetical protein VFF65_08235, partial [Phycisphaerales bacterium]|nr:hypothetical protein [Phycisphaerales bacterium]